MYQRWIIDRGTLIITGDCYDSIYKWNESGLTLKFLATCGIDYFSSKCKADKDGSDQKTFESDAAQEYLKRVAVDRILDSFEDEFDGIDWESLSEEKRFELVTPIIMRELEIEEYEVDQLFYCDNVHSGYEIISNSEYEFMFGTDGWEYGSGLEVMTRTPQWHLSALRVAYLKYPEAF